MKTGIMSLALVLLVGFLAAGCATVSRFDTEYEEEMARVEKMSPEEKEEYERTHAPYSIDWSDIDRDADGGGGDGD